MPSSTNSSPRTIYVERLTLQWLLRSASLFKKSTERSYKVRVFFLDHDGPALFLSRIFTCIYPVTFQEFRFQCSEIIDKEGISIRLKASYIDLAVLGRMIRRGIPAVLEDDSRLPLYLMKAPVSIYDLYGDGKYCFLRNAVIFINFVRWHIDKIDALKDVPELHLFQRPFFEELCEYAQTKDIKLCSMKPYRSQGSLGQKVVNKFSKLNGKVIQGLLRHALSAVFRPKDHHQKDIPARDTRLLVESRLVFNLSHPELVSDLFFLEGQEGIEGKDVRLVFNGVFNPVNEDKFKEMQGSGIEAIALTPQSSLVSPFKVPIFSWNKADLHMDERWHFSELPADYAQYVAEYARIRSYWEAFFKDNNIKLWTSFYKNDAALVAMSDALTAVGGVSTIYQRSYESNPTSIVTVGSDIIFSFSKAEYAIEMKSGSDFRYHVAAGYLGDYRFGLLKKQAGELRERLFLAGAKHIVAYFDEGTIDDGRWFFDHHFAQENYAFWLEKLLANPGLGLIFKPKVPKTLRKRLGAVAQLLTKAQETGRCYVFEQGEIQSSFPPAAASMASDIAVHDMLGSASAGLESALGGTRTVLMDFEGWPLSPLYRLGDEVVFRDWEKTWQACSEYFKDPFSRPRLGDWSSMINELDPFHDGLAAHRMSCYLKDLLEGLRRGERPVDVMERVAENYAKRWGKDKVQRGPRM